MAEKILLLGHARESGLALAKRLIGLGYYPLANDWTGFTPRSYGRSRRPLLMLANVDHPAAKPLPEFAPWVRKTWGQSYPIIAVTASGRFRDAAAHVDAGASDCLAPDAPQALLERKIARALQGGLSPALAELAEEIPTDLFELFLGNAELARLGDLAGIYPGATPRRTWCRRMAPPDDSWRGVATSGTVDRFYVGKPSEYLLWSRFHLFRLPAPEEYNVPEKVFLSRSGPPLAAAVDKSRLAAGTDVYSLVPREGVGASFLACLLNSRLLDFYYNRLAGATDGRLRIETLRDTPVPLPTQAANREFSRIATLLAHFGPSPQSWIDRQSKDELLARMEDAVFELYGAGNEARSGLAALHF